MKKKNILWIMALMVLATAGLVGCVKEYSMWVSSQDFRFGLEQGTDTLIIRANCKWTITKNDGADWYTVSPMSGKAKDSIVIVTVKDYSHGDFRGASFVVNSPGGHVYRTVFVSQNKIDFYGIVNKVFGVTFVEHWNTDYFDQMIEDSYKHAEYDPYDTTKGYLMYFMEDGKGIQRDRHGSKPVYFAFTYEYDHDSRNLHLEFETVTDTLEIYDEEVLTASDSLYRIFSEYKPHFFERADHRKVGTITAGEKALLQQKTTKRKKGDPLYIIE